MCELITIAATVAFTVWHFAAKKSGRPDGAVFTTMLMFWGAALMWSVDCVAGAIEGEDLLDLSAHDAVLGAIVVTAGLAVFGMLALARKFHAARP